jgi:thioesterase domain-containing protein/acyl carrier protein
MPPHNIEAIYPLSASQQGMLLETLGAQAGIHVEQAVFELHAELDSDRFHQAWRAVNARHAILRTAFSWEAHSEPVQVVLREVDVPMRLEDWRGAPADAQARRLDGALDADRELGFQVKRAPLVRLLLARTGDRTYRFVLSFHHIVLDGWSLSLVLAEAMAIYEALTRGVAPALPPPVPYRSYINWVRERPVAPAQAYWQAYLRGVTRPTPLGRELPCDADREESYGELTVRVDDAVAAALVARAREHHITPGLVFQAAWGLVLGRYSGDRDVVFGTTVSGRPASLPGALTAVGLFINTVPMRLALPTDGLWPWLARVQAEHAAGRDHEHCSTGQIHRWRDREATGALYESLLVFENYPEDTSVLTDASVRVDLVDSRTVGARTGYPVTLLVGSRAGFSLKLIHQRRRVDDAAAATMVRHLQSVLAAMTAEAPAVPALIDAIAADDIPTVYAQQVTVAPELRRWVGPRDVTELRLATLWGEILEHDGVGVYDSFFDLGGHSLLALDLMERIEADFGVRLPMSTLLQHPTIEALAGQLRAGVEARAWSPLVTIRASGRGAPFFCIPGAAMDAISLHPLAHALGEDHPFHGIQPRGLDGRQAPHRTVEEMAAAVVEAMRSAQPRGPYYLGGHSFGAHVAFEAAQQLGDAGCEVALLALVDAEASTLGQGPATPARDDTDRLARLLSLVQRFFGREVPMALDTDLPPQDLVEHVARKLADARILPAGLGAERVRSYLAVGEATALAFDSYRAVGRHPVDTLLFRARQLHRDDAVLGGGDPGDESLGWRRLCQREVTVRWVPGDHVTVMTRPNVEVIAGHLRDAMRRGSALARRRQHAVEAVDGV